MTDTIIGRRCLEKGKSALTLLGNNLKYSIPDPRSGRVNVFAQREPRIRKWAVSEDRFVLAALGSDSPLLGPYMAR